MSSWSLAEADPTALFVASLVVIALAVAGFFLATWVKKQVKETDQQPAAGFSLADLRQLHKSGKLSDVEYERARAKMVVDLKRAAEKPKEPASQSTSSPKKSG